LNAKKVLYKNKWVVYNPKIASFNNIMLFGVFFVCLIFRIKYQIDNPSLAESRKK